MKNLHQCSRFIHIFSYCTVVITVATCHMTTYTLAKTQGHMKTPKKQVQQKGYNIDVVWRGGNVNIPSNNLADRFHLGH